MVKFDYLKNMEKTSSTKNSFWVIWSCWHKKVIETFLLVCEASYGPIGDCGYQLFYFSLGTSLSGAISAIFAQIPQMLQNCQ